MDSSDPSSDVPIRVSFHSNIEPPVFDLSGLVSFELHLGVRRSVDEDPRPLTIQTSGSVFDSSAALAKGLYKLTDTATGEEVELPTTSSPPPDLEPFITLPPDSKGHPVVHKLPLKASSWLQGLKTPDTKYRIELRDPKNPHIQWWHWGAETPPTPLPPSSPGSITSQQSSCGLQFPTALNIPPPPGVTVSLSTLPDSGGKSVLATTTNPTTQTFTLKTSGQQPYRRRLDGPSPDPPSDPSALVVAHTPAPKNLSVADAETGEEVAPDKPTFICGETGWPRSQFLTLRPGDSVKREVKLPGGHNMQKGREYRVRLRERGCWWVGGTVEELFREVGEGETLKKLPARATLPVRLGGDGEGVVVEWEG